MVDINPTTEDINEFQENERPPSEQVREETEFQIKSSVSLLDNESFVKSNEEQGALTPQYFVPYFTFLSMRKIYPEPHAAAPDNILYP